MAKRVRVFLPLLSLILSFLVLLQPVRAAEPEGASLTVHFLDVGQGLCVLLESDGHYALYDGGGPESAPYVVSYLKEQGVMQLDLVIASHYDIDHVSGLVGVLHVFPVLEVWGPGYTAGTNVYRTLREAAEDQGLSLYPPEQNETRMLGSAELRVLSDGLFHDKENDRSIVIRASDNQSRLLITGDLTVEGEQELIDQGVDLDADILVLGHHGSSSSTSWSFLASVTPSSVIVSCGNENDFGHPSVRTMERVRTYGAALFRTDQQGTVTAVFLPGGEILWNTAQSDDYSGRIWTPDEEEEGSEESDSVTYILNGSSFKFHRPECEKAFEISPRNRVEFTGTREEAIALGYIPCGYCKP